jgi:hypothetical protein
MRLTIGLLTNKGGLIVKQYSLTGSKEQLALVARALDMYSRIGMGQFEAIAEHPEVEKRIRIQDNISGYEAAQTFAYPKQVLFGLNMNASLGIHNETLGDDVRSARDIFKVIEHQQSWDNAGNPKSRDLSTMGGNNFDYPQGLSNNALPTLHCVTT